MKECPKCGAKVTRGYCPVCGTFVESFDKPSRENEKPQAAMLAVEPKSEEPQAITPVSTPESEEPSFPMPSVSFQSEQSQGKTSVDEPEIVQPQPAASIATLKKRFCSQCGQEVSLAARFCASCGSPLEDGMNESALRQAQVLTAPTVKPSAETERKLKKLFYVPFVLLIAFALLMQVLFAVPVAKIADDFDSHGNATYSNFATMRTIKANSKSDGFGDIGAYTKADPASFAILIILIAVAVTVLLIKNGVLHKERSKLMPKGSWGTLLAVLLSFAYIPFIVTGANVLSYLKHPFGRGSGSGNSEMYELFNDLAGEFLKITPTTYVIIYVSVLFLIASLGISSFLLLSEYGTLGGKWQVKYYGEEYQSQTGKKEYKKILAKANYVQHPFFSHSIVLVFALGVYVFILAWSADVLMNDSGGSVYDSVLNALFSSLGRMSAESDTLGLTGALGTIADFFYGILCVILTTIVPIIILAPILSSTGTQTVLAKNMYLCSYHYFLIALLIFLVYREKIRRDLAQNENCFLHSTITKKQKIAYIIFCALIVKRFLLDAGWSFSSFGISYWVRIVGWVVFVIVYLLICIKRTSKKVNRYRAELTTYFYGENPAEDAKPLHTWQEIKEKAGK